MARTLNETIQDITENYLDCIDVDNPPEPSDIEAELLTELRGTIALENNTRAKGEKLKAPDKLCTTQIAAIMNKLYPIVRIKCGGENADPDYDLLAIYKDSGPNEGIYVTSEDEFKRIAKKYNYTISAKELKDVLEIIRIDAPRVSRCTDKDLIAVNNGIFNFDTKQLEAFNPDRVFMAKSRVNYNPFATNVVIHNDEDDTDWDVESWMNELSDDPEIVELLWEILSAIIRPNVRWNKSAWLYAETGNNGKGTLCELMRSLCGDGSYAAIPINDFAKDFMLEPLTRATAIIVDENDVGTFIDKAANLKAIITSDVIPINRKFKQPIAYQFYGFMVQCLNEFPRIKDKSDSLYRRQLFIPFDKCFTGHERKYIKNDYLHRDEVLEYVMYKVLHMNFYTLSEPSACKNALQEYKEFNDPIRQFAEEMFPEFTWDLLPFSFLYDLYKSWFRKNSPNGSIQGKNTFIASLINLLPQYPNWYCKGRNVAIRPGHKMDNPELLIMDYDLKDWESKSYNGGDPNKRCIPSLKYTYNGLLRRVADDVDDEADGVELRVV